jgi:excinuclease ABC subunit C
MSVNYKSLLPLLPEKPGVYQFINSSGQIIYVGKAKNLKKRITSYFAKNQSAKTMVMLKKAADMQHIVVETESDALLLENNLIKKHQPRYNILLKDDKTFPWICIKNERFPRVFSTRKPVRDGSLYFGPYTSGLMVKILLDLIRQLYQLRTCNLNLSDENIKSGKFKICLEYHIGNCKGPCEGYQNEFEYSENVQQIRNILRGNISSVIDYLNKLMLKNSKEMRFEEAQVMKEKIEILTKYRSRSTVVSASIKNVDVFGISQDTNNLYINYLKVVDGSVIQAFTLDIKSRIDEEMESLLGFAITEIRERVSSDSPEIIIRLKPDLLLGRIKYTIPERGEKLKLLELAERNAIYYKLEQRKKHEEIIAADRTHKNLEKMKSDLHMAELPVHIECFDNSNIMGKNPVASCVVFRNSRPARKDYRHFNVKSVKGPNDFSSIEEIVYRRYKRMIEEKQSLPQLIIIDGGKGQLSSAMKSLEKLGLQNKVSLIGIAKKLEEIYFPGDRVPVYFDKNSISLKIIQNIRNEAHRFGINFHRDKRSSDMTRSNLDNIKGIGIKTKEILLKEIGSVEKIKMVPFETLENLIGKQKATILAEYLKNLVQVPRGKDF